MGLFRGNSTNEASKKGTSHHKASKQQRRVDPVHIGDLGEYKVNIQLAQFPKEYRHVSDVLLANPRSGTGFSQIDHILITSYGLFVIETKNYQGSIRGKRRDRYWRVNSKFNMLNPVKQNHGHLMVVKSILAEFDTIPFVSMVSFTRRCSLNIDEDLRQIESNELVVYDLKLTDYIERKVTRLKIGAPNPPLSAHDIERIVEIISNHNISDPGIREEHNRKASELRKDD